MSNGDAQPGLVPRGFAEHARELLERLLPAADTGDGDDLAVLDREDRLDVEERPGERLGAADPAPFLQVLERADGEDHSDVAPEPRHQRVDLLVGRAP